MAGTMPLPRRALRTLGYVAVPAVSSVIAGCTASPVTVEADQVRVLYDIFLVAAGAVFVVVAGLIGWSIVRYRSRGSTELPAQTRTNLALELIWWALPTALVIGLFIASAQVLGQVDRTADPSVNLRVEASQWQWRFTYLTQGVVISVELGRQRGLAVESESGAPGIVDYLTTTDHKQIGLLYLFTGLAFFLISGALSLLMRAELTLPGL